MKRLFTALPLSDEFKEKLFYYFQNSEFKNIKWTKEENLHITLHFIGNVSEEKISEIINCLKTIYEKRDGFELEFNKVIFGPPGRMPNMIWAVFKRNEQFITLSQMTAKAIGQEEEQNIIPHITLSRFRNSRMGKTILPQISLPALKISTIVLMESQLLPEGPIYQVLKRFDLK